jgi:hypothetical protein
MWLVNDTSCNKSTMNLSRNHCGALDQFRRGPIRECSFVYLAQGPCSSQIHALVLFYLKKIFKICGIWKIEEWRYKHLSGGRIEREESENI